MKRISKIGVLVVALCLAATVLLAQHNHGSAGSGTSSSRGCCGKKSSSNNNSNSSNGYSTDIVRSCEQHGAKAIAILDQMDINLTAARESNDQAKMRAALGRAEADLSQARYHLSACPITSATMRSSQKDSTGDMGNMDHSNHMNH